MSKEKFSIREFAERVADSREDSYDAVIIIGVGENSSHVDMAGIDPAGIGFNAIKAAAAMRMTLNSELDLALRALERLEAQGHCQIRYGGKDTFEYEGDRDSDDDSEQEGIRLFLQLAEEILKGGRGNAVDD